VTARECAPWLARPDFLELSVADRVRYVRRNLRGRAQDGGMTQPELAAAVGIRDSRHHTIINWEKGKSEPKRYKKSLSDLTPYEPDDFVVQRGAAGVSLESLDARLDHSKVRSDRLSC
jgi:DNA-binding XRE family transcriptional regulator